MQRKKISTYKNISNRMIARLSNVETQDVASQMYSMYIFEEGITRLRHGSIKFKHSVQLFLVTINCCNYNNSCLQSDALCLSPAAATSNFNSLRDNREAIHSLTTMT